MFLWLFTQPDFKNEVFLRATHGFLRRTKRPRLQLAFYVVKLYELYLCIYISSILLYRHKSVILSVGQIAHHLWNCFTCCIYICFHSRCSRAKRRVLGVCVGGCLSWNSVRHLLRSMLLVKVYLSQCFVHLSIKSARIEIYFLMCCLRLFSCRIPVFHAVCKMCLAVLRMFGKAQKAIFACSDVVAGRAWSRGSWKSRAEAHACIVPVLFCWCQMTHHAWIVEFWLMPDCISIKCPTMCFACAIGL